MAPREWREGERLRLEDVAARLAPHLPRKTCARQSVWHYETGRRDAPTSIALAYEKISKGKVTSEDLHSVRREWLREQAKKAA